MSNVIPWPGQVDQDAITVNFLERLLPPHGIYCACIKQGATMRQSFYESVESLWAALREGDRGGHDVYFALASFSDHHRTIDACAEKRNLSLDMDYGQGHARPGYETYDDARAHLKAFCLKVGLPVPMVVESGGGFHVHWAFREAIPKAKWQRYANGLKAACLDFGLRADHSLTTNPVVILRPPGTMNRKLAQARPVKFDPQWLQFSPGDWPDALFDYADDNVVRLPATKLPPKPEFLNDNQYPEAAFPDIYEQVDIKLLASACGVVNEFTKSGNTSEPAWMRLANLFHYVNEGERLYHRFSQQNYDKYDRAETQRKWDRANGLTGPPLCRGFKDSTDEKTRATCLACPKLDVIKTPLQGVELDRELSDEKPVDKNEHTEKPEQKKPPYVEWDRTAPPALIIKGTFKNAALAISRLDLVCRHNTFHLKKTVDEEPLTDAVSRVVREKIIVKFRFDPGKPNVQDALDRECERNPYDPVDSYLHSLAWDKSHRLDPWLCRYLGAEDTPLNRTFGRKTLIAAIRRVRQPGCKFDYMTVLEGPQRAGKSSAWRILAGDENFSDERIMWDKPLQQKEASGGVWIHEIAELVGLRRAEQEAVKSFLSRQNDRGRAAYDRFSSDQLRRCIHVGSTNPTGTGYWPDPTGASRLWPVKVGQIDLDALREDRDQLWAEAAHYEATGEPLELPPSLYAAAAEVQGLRRVYDPWEEYLADIEGNHVSSREVFERYIGQERARMSPGDGVRVASIMRRLGWDGPKTMRVDGKVVKGYERSL